MSITRAAPGSRAAVTRDAGSPDLPRTIGLARAKALFSGAIEDGVGLSANALLQAAVNTLSMCGDPAGSQIEAVLSLDPGATFADAVAAATA
jgi:hypothetical protein